MDHDRLLVGVSAAQLTTGVVSTVVAVRRRRSYDLPFLHGRPEHVARDAVFIGTALSAPAVMLAVQAVETARLLRGAGPRARSAIGALGAVMVAGYFGERLVRVRLRRCGYDPVESSLAVAGILSAAAMAGLAFTSPPPASVQPDSER